MYASAERQLSADRIGSALAQGLPTYPRAAIVVTTGEGRVVSWNAGAERLFGWRARDALSQDILGLIPAVPTRDKAAEIFAYLQSGQFWAGEMAMRRRCGLPLIAYVMQFPVGDLAHGRGAIVGVSVAAAQRRLVAGDAPRIAAALRRRVEGGLGGSHPIGGLRAAGFGPPAPRAKPGVYAPIGSIKPLAALHRRRARPDNLWRLMQRIETYRYRAEQLARSPQRLRAGRDHLARMWLRLADELHQVR